MPPNNNKKPPKRAATVNTPRSSSAAVVVRRSCNLLRGGGENGNVGTINENEQLAGIRQQLDAIRAMAQRWANSGSSDQISKLGILSWDLQKIAMSDYGAAADHLANLMPKQSRFTTV